MSAIPCFPELQFRCTSDAGLLPAHAIRLCCEGFRLHMDRAARQHRLMPLMALAPFVSLVVFALLFGTAHRTIPMLECFIGMLGWVGIFYGMSGRAQWACVQTEARLRAARMNAWCAMLGRFALSMRRTVEQRIRTSACMWRCTERRLRASLRIRLGLTDPNLTAFRLVPPVSTHA